MKVTRAAPSGTSTWNEESPENSIGASTGPRRKPAGCPGGIGPPVISGKVLSMNDRIWG